MLAIVISRPQAAWRRRAFVLVVLCGVLAVVPPAGAGYVEPASFTTPQREIIIGSPGYSANQSNDSAVFQLAIDAVAAAGGGRVIVPAASYSVRDVSMKSDVHIVFDGPSTITVNTEGVGATQNINAFEMGDGGRVQNTSIRAINGTPEFVLDRTDHDRVHVFSVSDAQNFLLSNFTIHDDRTIFSSIGIGWNQNTHRYATDGAIEHITSLESHYGYGAIQVQAGRNLDFRNIQSTGGVALRLETGWKTMNLAQDSGLFDIHAEDITSYNGQAALMLSPHAMHHGAITAAGIRSVGSEYAVLIENGSLHKFSEQEVQELGLTLGTFESIHIDGIDATYSDNPIETRWVHLLHYPEELHPLVYEVDEPISEHNYMGPSIAPVHNALKNHPSVTLENIVSRGFLFHPDQIDESDYYKGHWRDVIQEGPILPGDANRDGVVDAADYTLWRDNLNSPSAPFEQGDANGDSFVDLSDYEVWRRNYGRSITAPASATAAPDPASASLVLAIALLSYGDRATRCSDR